MGAYQGKLNMAAQVLNYDIWEMHLLDTYNMELSCCCDSRSYCL